MSFIITFDQFKASLLNKSINFCNFSPPPKKNKNKLYWLQVSCCRKQKKIEQEEHVAGDGLIIESAIWISASRRRCESGRTSGFPSNGCNLSSSAHERYFIRENENAIKTILKTVGCLQKYTPINHPRRVFILKRAVLMFIQRSQTPQINNTGNVYRNIGNVFKNHITVI